MIQELDCLNFSALSQASVIQGNKSFFGYSFDLIPSSLLTIRYIGGIMKKTVRVKTFVPAPQAFVFEVFTNHETYKELPGVLRSTLLTEGEEYASNGLGAIREIRTISFTLKEKVVAVERPIYWDYLFLEWPLPVPHAGGRMQFEEVDGGTIVHWETSYSTQVAWPLKASFPAISVMNTMIIKSLSVMLKSVAVNKNV